MNLLENVQSQLEAGKTDAALKQVQQALAANPEDPEAKRAAAHVYYDLTAKAYEAGDLDEAIKQFGNYYALVLPEEDADIHEKFKFYQRRIHPEFSRMQEANKLSKAGKNMEALAIYENVLTTLRDFKVAYVNVGWCLYRLLAELATQEDPDLDLITKCFAIYKRFEILGPSNLHSQMLRIALYFKDTDTIDLMEFLHDWNFTNFREEDLQPFKTAKNSTIPSLCERAYLTYARVLFAGIGSGDDALMKKSMLFANEFLPELDAILERLPRNIWLPYARAILMSKMGKGARVQMELIHILKQKNNEFWAWASLAESYLIVGKEQEAIACFAKSFLLPSQSELAIQLRETFAALLVKNNWKVEAKTEIELITIARKKKDAKVSKQIQEWRDSSWYREIRAPHNNKMLYIRFAGRADSLLWADVAESIAIVTHVDKERGVFFFAVDKKIGGKQLIKKPFERVQIGDVFALKLREADPPMGSPSPAKIWKVISGRPEKEKVPEEICRRLYERVQIPFGRDFGFMKPSNVYVGPEVVKKYGLADGQTIKGLALLSFNKAKNEWGWKMINVEES
jgi:tetratricopeptide (TPR) repeat protein